MLKKHIEQAEKRKFSNSSAQLQQLQFFLGLVGDDAFNAPLKDYVVGALNELEYRLSEPTMTDKALSEQIADVARALQITQELIQRSRAHREEVAPEKAKIVQKFYQEHGKLQESIYQHKKRLSAGAMVQINQKIAKMLEEVYGDKKLPQFIPSSATATNGVSPNDPKKLGFKFLDAFSKLFKGLSDPSGDTQGAMQSFAGAIVELVVGALGDFFKIFLGKEAAPKIDELVSNAGAAFTHIVGKEVEQSKESKKSSPGPGFTPSFSKQKKDKSNGKEEKEKEKEQEYTVKSKKYKKAHH